MSEAPRAALARFLRQRAELGEHEIFLDALTRTQLLALAAQAELTAPPEPTAAAPAPRRSGEAVAESEPPSRPAAASPEAVSPAVPATRSRSPGRAAKAPAQPKAPEGTPGVSSGLPVLPDDYDALRDIALSCTRCGLAETRTQVVFSDGAPDAKLVVVGEAPGANEDETGLPFVGAAGKYLDLLLKTVDLSREDSVYICNVLKCRPPGNRDPRPEEIGACTPFLVKQLELIRPKALLAVGSFAARFLTGRDKSALGKLRGEVHVYHGVPLVVTYHPAALLRNPRWTRAFWDDLQLLRPLLDSA